MPPGSKIVGHIVFVLSVILSSAKNVNLGYNFWMVRVRAVIFQMSIPFDKTFPLVPTFFTLWPWCLRYMYVLNTLTLAIYFDWKVLGRWHFTRVFLWTGILVGTKTFDLVTLMFDLLVKNYNLGYIFWIVCTRSLIYEYLLWQDLSIGIHIFFYLVTLTLMFDLLKTLPLATSFEW
jgi:hypothetical protein